MWKVSVDIIYEIKWKAYENSRWESVLNLTCLSVILIRNADFIITFTSVFSSSTLSLTLIFLKFSYYLILDILVPIAFSRAFAFF